MNFLKVEIVRRVPFALLVLAALLLVPFSCEEGEVVDPIPPREVNLEVVVESDGDMRCVDLQPIDAEPLPVWELVCRKKTIRTGVSCEDFDLWLIGSLDKLNGRLGSDLESDECNVNFEYEMVLGTCTNRRCSEQLTLCDAKFTPAANRIRYLQAFTCTDDDASLDLVNHFLVVPRTGRDFEVEIHRHLTDPE